ncbi:MAG: beta-propeller domain-containing protein [Clostridia bacterium]|nr:beta-propeller domain-containing protein [Clostridia bacterium]
MKFQEEYQAQCNRIHADESTKNALRETLAADMPSAFPVPARKRRAAILRSAVSLAACAALILTVVFAARREERQTIPSVTGLQQPKSYSSIYKTVKTFLPDRSFEFFKKYSGEYTADGYAVANDFQTEESASVPSAAVASKGDYSETTKQVEGVDEADVVKTDGKNLYCLSYRYTEPGEKTELRIVNIEGEKPSLLSSVTIDHNQLAGNLQMYVSGDRLILVGSEFALSNEKEPFVYADGATARPSMFYGGYRSAYSFLDIYDISDQSAPKRVDRLTQSGTYSDSRMIDGTCYLITDYSLWPEQVEEEDPTTYVPWTCKDDETFVVPAESICLYDYCQSAQYTVVCGYDVSTGDLFATQSVFGGSGAVYCNTENLVTAGYARDDKTQIVRFSLTDHDIKAVASTTIDGTLLNQFSIDEYKGNFRFVTTEYRTKIVEENGVSYVTSDSSDTVNSLLVLDGSLKPLGSIRDLAPGERVYSVRFMGDTAYFVTFRQVDPLFSADLSDPKHPKILGSLKIPGFSNYLFPYGEGQLLGIGQNADEETGRTDTVKLSMFDIHDPANVTEIAKADTDALYAEALYNHKAALADAGKNLIGFAAESEETVYLLYAYENGKFVKKAQIPVDKDTAQIRGLYAGNTFYIVSGVDILYFPIDDPDNLQRMTF